MNHVGRFNVTQRTILRRAVRTVVEQLESRVHLAGGAVAQTGQVWFDANQNGHLDASDSFVSGVVVNLYSGAGTLADSTTSDSGGNYRFEQLAADEEYYVEFVAPPHMRPIDGGDSDAIAASATTSKSPTYVAASVVPYHTHQYVGSVVYADDVPQYGDDDEYEGNIEVTGNSPYVFNQRSDAAVLSAGDVYEAAGSSSLSSTIGPDRIYASASYSGWSYLDSAAVPSHAVVEGYGTALFDAEFAVIGTVEANITVELTTTNGIGSFELSNDAGTLWALDGESAAQDWELTNDYFRLALTGDDGAVSGEGSGGFYISADFTQRPIDAGFVLAPLPNDSFAGRIDLGSVTSGTWTGDNLYSGGETGEPYQSGVINSVWWTWTAPADGSVILDTNGSNFDTYLTLATGTSVDSLAVLAQNDDAGEGLCSQIRYAVTAGSQYQIAVDGWSSGNGNVTLSLHFVDAQAGTVVTIPDANLQAAIRDALGQPSGDITDLDMQWLTELSAGYREITNLAGLEYATNLRDLYLDANQISDIAPLAGLTQLNYLNLGQNQISDIAPLAGLTSLDYVYLNTNQISDIAPLAELGQLSYLNVSENRLNVATGSQSMNVIEALQEQGVYIYYLPQNPNLPPVVSDFLQAVEEDGALSIGIGSEGFFVDPDGDAIAAVKIMSLPTHGVLTLGGNPVTVDQVIAQADIALLLYTPAPDYAGPDSFLWTASDGQSFAETPAAVNIAVVSVNDAPVAFNGTPRTDEDAPVNGSVGASDIDSSTLTYSIITNPAHGTLVLNADGSFTYTPGSNYNGPDSFTFKASDGVADSNTATVDLTIAPVNDAPVAAGQTITTDEDIASSGTVLATDVDGNALIYSVVTQPQHGILVLQANGAFTYTPSGNYNGPDSFTFKASDGVADSNTASVSINVAAVNDAPTGITLSKSSLNENLASGTVIGTLSGTDPDTAAVLTFSLPAGVGDNGSFRLENGQLKSNAVFNCEARSSYLVTVRASDGTLTLDKQFTITVSNVNERPAGLTLSKSSVAEHAVTGTVVGSFTGTDVDAANTFTYSLVSGTGSTDNAAFQIVGNQLKTRWPLDYEGKKSYAIRVRVQDQGGLYYDKAFTIGVTNITESGAVALTVTGKGTADAIALSMVNGKLRVTSNGVINEYVTSRISSITINAGAGADKVTIGAGVRAVKVVGGDGNDTITGGDNADSLDGGVGNDSLIGGAENDTLLGGIGIDILRGGTGNDRLDGGSGADALYGDDGDDALLGGPGMIDAVLDNDVLSGGLGKDTADYSARRVALKLSLDGVANDGMTNEKDNIKTDVENISGGTAADLITGSTLANVLKGNGGNDSIYGGSGNDSLYGNAGADKLYGEGSDDLLIPGAEGSKDTLTGGTGTDRYQQADLIDVRVDAMTLLI